MAEVFNIFKERKATYSSGGKDSVVKVIDVYFSAVTKKPFTFGKKIYQPLPLHISPTVLRDFICHAECGACCRDFTLDWLPGEIMPNHKEISLRPIYLNDKEYYIYTDYNNQEVKDKFGTIRCHNLNEQGRCGIHQKHPFSCDFELLRFRKYDSHWVLCHQYFGRGWNMKRVFDGERGAMCEMLPHTEEGRKETIRKLNRLKDWTDYFELETHLDDIIKWVSTISLTETKPLVLGVEGETLEDFFI